MWEVCGCVCVHKHIYTNVNNNMNHVRLIRFSHNDSQLILLFPFLTFGYLKLNMWSEHLLFFDLSQKVNDLSAIWETLGWKDPLEKEMATHFSILAWRIPRTEEPGGLQFIG